MLLTLPFVVLNNRRNFDWACGFANLANYEKNVIYFFENHFSVLTQSTNSNIVWGTKIMISLNGKVGSSLSPDVFWTITGSRLRLVAKSKRFLSVFVLCVTKKSKLSSRIVSNVYNIVPFASSKECCECVRFKPPTRISKRSCTIDS